MSNFTDDNRPYQPRGGALELFYCKDPEIVVEGPAGTGKSRGVLEKIFLCMEKYPGSRALITRKTRESMSESVLFTWEMKVVPAGHPILANDSLRSHRQKYTFPNKSEVIVAGLDKPGKIMSTEYDIIAAFEGIELFEDDWEKLTTRLRNHVIPYQQAIIDVNPDAEFHWVNQRANKGMMTRILSRHEDNPTLYDAETKEWTLDGKTYISTLDRLTGARKERLRYGRWCSAEGMVYEQYDPKIHLIDRFDPPADWPKIRIIDFGYTNPFVCQWWAFDYDGRAYLYREIYKTQVLVEDHAREINRLSRGESYEANVCDHDAEDRATLERHGVGQTTAAFKEVIEGVQVVQEFLRVQPDGKPRLFFMRDTLTHQPDEKLVEKKLPTCTVQEITSYIWPKPKEGQAVKEEPVKLNDHGMDGTRYMAMYRTKRIVAAGGVVELPDDNY